MNQADVLSTVVAACSQEEVDLPGRVVRIRVVDSTCTRSTVGCLREKCHCRRSFPFRTTISTKKKTFDHTWYVENRGISC